MTVPSVISDSWDTPKKARNAIVIKDNKEDIIEVYKIKENNIIKVVVSKGQKVVEVPKVVGEEKNKAMVSRVIKAAVDEGYIKLADENAVVKMRRYIPYWA